MEVRLWTLVLTGRCWSSQDLVEPSLRFEAADVGPHWPAAAAILRPGQVGPETINYINRDADCPDYD